MQLSTKYDYGQHVYCLTRSSVDMPPVRCDACEGEKVVDVRGAMYPCPKCSGVGHIVKKDSGFHVGGSGTVGQIRSTHETVTDRTCFEWWEHEPAEGSLHTVNEYMLDTTGIGSGSIRREHNLFATREEAQAEADRRNDYVRGVR